MKAKTKNIIIIVAITGVILFGFFFSTRDNSIKGFTKTAKTESILLEDRIVEESSTYKATSSFSANRKNSNNSNMQILENGQAEVAQERKIIKTGSLNYEVKNLSETEKEIQNWLKNYDGYIANSWSNRNSLNLTVKVPSEKFEEAMSSAGEFGKLEYRSISTEDVTENYYDLETRLNARKILQDKLKGYLKDAKNISDLLEVERQLNDVTSEIESMEKQFRRLSNQINFSTISITCKLPDNTNEAGFESPDFFQSLKDFAYNALHFIADFGIFILYIIVFGIPILLLIALIYWLCFGKIGLVRKLFNKLKE